MDLESSLQRMTKELTETVKAIIESKLGKLGSVCSLSVEEFVGKLKAALEQLVGTAVPVGSGVDHTLTSVASAQLETPRSPLDAGSVRSANLSQISDVPTAFAGVRSVVSKEGGVTTSAAAKPGRVSQKTLSCRVLWAGSSQCLRLSACAASFCGSGKGAGSSTSYETSEYLTLHLCSMWYNKGHLV